MDTFTRQGSDLEGSEGEDELQRFRDLLAIHSNILALIYARKVLDDSDSSDTTTTTSTTFSTLSGWSDTTTTDSSLLFAMHLAYTRQLAVCVDALEAERAHEDEVLEGETWDDALYDLGVQTDAERYQRIATWIDVVQQHMAAERDAAERQVQRKVGSLGKRQRDEGREGDEPPDSDAGKLLKRETNPDQRLRKTGVQESGPGRGDVFALPEAGPNAGDRPITNFGRNENAAMQGDDEVDAPGVEWNAERRRWVAGWVDDIRASKRRRISMGDV
ncbi:hypothetical protein BV22DRAFT_1028873 [Leucogyrophana mollusca]|uniref:Uncharacterized protein n=1 Tax=Leucogyrophana mollusca TaxID=85980 RepID=A0ACB8BWR1_9AGAM|nr:hypothetical protein BV22DRAFT_1028873 [Leucogyrophana mollusca]